MYWFTKFGSTIFTANLPDDDLSTGQAKAPIIELPGGAIFDPIGPDIAPSGSDTITIRRAVLSQAIFEQLRALKGYRDKLWRTWDNGRQDWCLARCLGASTRRTLQNLRYIEVDLSFQRLSPVWYSSSITNTGSITDSNNPTTFTLTNIGNAATNNVNLKFTINNGISSIQITTTNSELLYQDTSLTTGDIVTFNCGAKSIQKNNMGDYNNFSLGPSHSISSWLQLELGSNTMEIFIGGTTFNVDYEITYYSGWQ